jgi:hypothetical protein
MTRQTQIAMCITLDGAEQDVEVRADVELELPDERHGRSYARVDGDVEVLVGDAWLGADTLTLATGDRARIGALLCEQALEDWLDGEHLRAEHYADARERAQDLADEDRRSAR